MNNNAVEPTSYWPATETEEGGTVYFDSEGVACLHFYLSWNSKLGVKGLSGDVTLDEVLDHG